MNKNLSSKISDLITKIILVIGAIVILFPIYITIITALKTPQESAKDFFSIPKGIYLENFLQVFQKSNYGVYVANSLKITTIAVVCIMVLVPMCAYAIARKMDHSRYYRGIYLYFMIGIFVPFQVIMIPLVQYLTRLKLLNQIGLIIMCLAFACSDYMFLLVSYIRSIPKDLEEAAAIDGCSTFKTYYAIVIPLIKPMLATVLIMSTLWIWNDFQMPLLILNQKPDMWTLPLFQYNFKSQYTFDYNLAFASYLASMLPVVIVYICMQKNIVSGLTQGAVKS